MYKLKIYLFLLLTIVTSLAYAQKPATETTILVMGDSLSAAQAANAKKSLPVEAPEADHRVRPRRPVRQGDLDVLTGL